MSAALVPEFHCDISGSADEPLFKIGEEFGEPLHCTEANIAELLTLLSNIISKSKFNKKDFDYRSMVSDDTVTPEMINPHEEMKKPDVRMKIMKIQFKIPKILEMMEDVSKKFISEHMGIIGTLTTWDCLYE